MGVLSDAEQAQVDLLRPLVGAWDGDDESLHDLLTTAGGDLDAAAAAGWRIKAAGAADMVDVSEGSSRRTLSQLSGLASAMASRFEARAASTAGSTGDGRTRSRPIVRS